MKVQSALAAAGFAAAALWCVPAAAADCTGPNRLLVSVQGLRSAKGEVAITVYPDDSRRFLAKGGKLARQRVSAAQPVTRVCFVLPAPGSYAVAVYHDENGDRHFGRTAVGLPKEGFGFSNDAPTPVGLPKFQAVRFPAAAGDTRTTIHVRYLKR